MENDRKAKQVIVIRKDLNMRKGKIAAQAAHASMKVILDLMHNIPITDDYVIKSLGLSKDSALYDWLDMKFTKICVYVNSEQELLDLYNKSIELNVICSLIEDCGFTEFHGVPTKTCIAIGPDWNESVDSITSGLPLL